MAEPLSKAPAAAKHDPEEALPGHATGLPSRLARGVAALSGIDMDDVRIHRNSAAPASLRAQAGMDGADRRSDQDQNPRAAWHVVEQKQGRAKPPVRREGGAAVDDDPGLEEEADQTGAKGLNLHSSPTQR